MYAWPKFGGYCAKIRAAMPLAISKLKCAWRAQFLSYAFQILQKYITFEDAQMTLLPWLKILALNRIYKKFKSLRVHLYDVHAQGNLWYNYTYSFLMFLYTYDQNKTLLFWILCIGICTLSYQINVQQTLIVFRSRCLHTWPYLILHFY